LARSAAAAAGAARERVQQGEQQQQQHLQPCMDMPPAGDGRGVCANWLRSLQLPAQVLHALVQSLAPPPPPRQQQGVQWRLLPSISPAWQQVARPEAQPAVPEGAAGAECAQRQPLCTAELPCLRFLLRDAHEIRAAYIPALGDWGLGDASAAAPAVGGAEGNAC
jgi:hypothetical protein